MAGGAYSVENAPSAVHGKMVVLVNVRAKIAPHKALEMHKTAALYAFQMKMIAAGMLRAEILVYASPVAVAFELSHKSDSAQLRQISVYRAFGVRVAVYRNADLVNRKVTVGMS